MADLRDAAVLYQVFDADSDPVVSFLEWLVERHGFAASPAVLDVGCGPGRLLPPLCALGWRVVGMEPDDVYRAHAARLAEPLGVSVLPGGFNDIAASAAFDLVLGINSSFAHVLTATDRAAALRRCRQALRPDGILVLDLPSLLRVLYEYREPAARRVEVERSVIHLRRRHVVDYHAATLTTHETYTVMEPNGDSWVVEKDHVYAITALPDLTYLVRQAGFDHVEVFGSMAERVPTRAGGRLILVARGHIIER